MKKLLYFESVKKKRSISVLLAGIQSEIKEALLRIALNNYVHQIVLYSYS